jgi:hypothetical protein
MKKQRRSKSKVASKPLDHDDAVWTEAQFQEAVRLLLATSPQHRTSSKRRRKSRMTNASYTRPTSNAR